MDINFASFIAVKLRDLMFGINNSEKNLQITLNCLKDFPQALADFLYFIFQFSINLQESAISTKLLGTYLDSKI